MSDLEDNILLKSDGWPTYNLANVIDDHLMGITHVIRGIEYLSSTPKYNLLYDALGWERPTYIHLPPVMKDKQHKLSKRNGDASYEDFIAKGYLKEAILNYIALLGWNPGGEREIYSLEELAEVFTLEGISKSSSIFDVEKLTWMNGEYIRALSPEEFEKRARPYLDEALGGVVEDCVNAVGVDVNTASAPLLRQVAGLTAATARNIVAYREENGAFSSRKQLLKVPKLGPKAFEQCAGFLRVPESKNVLDATAVHPESYAAAGALLEICGYTPEDVRRGGVADLAKRMEERGEEALAEQLGIGLPTLQDIAAELTKPGRDPRDELPPPLLRTDVMGHGGSETGHGAERHRPQRHRLRRFCGYRRCGRHGPCDRVVLEPD